MIYELNNYVAKMFPGKALHIRQTTSRVNGDPTAAKIKVKVKVVAGSSPSALISD